MRRGKGPNDRNYNVALTSDLLTVVYNSNGTVRSASSSKAAHRSARLTVDNPWRPKKPRGLDPTARSLNWWRVINPIVKTTTVGSAGRITVTTGPHTAPLAAEWNRWYLSTPVTGSDEQLRTEAILEALAKVKDQKWNAGVALAESSGVAKMAMDAMALIVRTRTALRKGEFAKAYRDFRKQTRYMSYPAWKRKYWAEVRHVRSVREAQHIPSGWLYYHFGIKPTLNDISDATLALQTNLVDLLYGRALFVRGYAKETTKHRENFKSGKSYNGFLQRDVLRSVRVTIRVRPKSYMVAKLSELGVTNPPEAVYNAIPFSWVLDYFTSFGSWLGALDTSLGWEFADTWSEAWRTTAKSTFTPVSNASITYGYPLEAGTISWKNVTRKVRGDLYGPMGSILPQWKRRGPSTQQLSNMLSVLATSMRVTIRP